MFSRRQRCSSWIRAWVIALALLALLGSTNAFSSGVSTSSFSFCSGDTSFIGDGYCDSSTNTVECGYDGGDCCSCECTDEAATFTCGANGFSCSDPSATACFGEVVSVSSTTSTTSDPSCSGVTSHAGDGECDSYNNSEECGYDGGDCCSCTCIDELFECGTSGFNCLDFSTACFGEEGASGVASFADDGEEEECTLSWISDGFCDGINNTDDCGYDGGDCCVCTCEPGDYDCSSGFNCIEPGVECEGEIGTGGECADSLIGDEICDPNNNNAACLYDGGDCCSGKRCDSDDCIDPNASCSGDTTSSKPSLERSRSNLLKVFIGVGGGTIGLVVVIWLAIHCVRVMLAKRKTRAQEAPGPVQ